MERKTFLKQIGGAGLVAMLPITSIMANSRSNPLVEKNKKGKVVLANEGKNLKIFGNNQVHKVVGKDNNNQLFEWIDFLAPGSGIPTHIHTKEDEVFRVMRGTVEFTIGEKTTVLTVGDIALAPKNIPHAWRVVGDKAAQMNVSVFPAGIEFMFEELDKLPPGPPNLEKVGEICAKYGIRFV